MIKFLICRGIGFSPGSVKYIPTMGFASAVAVVIVTPTIELSGRFATIAADGRFTQTIALDGRY